MSLRVSCSLMVLSAVVITSCGSATSPASPAEPSVVARVGTEQVTAATFGLRLQSAMTAISQGGGAAPSGSADAMLSRVRASVMRGLVVDAVIAQEAKRRGVATSDADIQKEIDLDAQAVGGQDALRRQVSQAGQSMDTLRDEIRSRLNEERLETLFAQSRAADAEAALLAGQDFGHVALTFSDDVTSNQKNGDVGSLTLTDLGKKYPELAAALRALPVGQTTQQPVRDRAGYDIVRVDSGSGDTRSIHRILIAAPQPYTLKERPSWFAASLFAALKQLCDGGKVQVFVDTGSQPCSAGGTSPAPSGSPTH